MTDPFPGGEPNTVEKDNGKEWNMCGTVSLLLEDVLAKIPHPRDY